MINIMTAWQKVGASIGSCGDLLLRTILAAAKGLEKPHIGVKRRPDENAMTKCGRRKHAIDVVYAPSRPAKAARECRRLWLLNSLAA